MSKPLRVLIVDDVDDDALLIVLQLQRAGFSPSYVRVDDAASMVQALKFEWQIVLCDYSMPGFSALEALEIVHKRGLDIPFIIVSGTVGEERAVEVMRAGAHDYVFKDNLSRLAVAIERELREARNRAERRRLQEQLLLSERMASIGLLAASVVHEINNPLTSLLGNLELAERALGERASSHDLPAVRELARVSEAANRIEQIVRDVRLFSRDSGDSGTTDVQTVLESSIRLAAHETAARCRIITRYERTPEVALSVSRLGQVCLNLLLNAAQAIPVGGLSTHHIIVSTRQEHGFVLLEITDNGCGIPDEIRGSLFEPFITTKALGTGTGLGLFITRRIVEDAGGSIAFASELAHGTTFRVLLPIAEAATTIAQDSSKSAPPRGTKPGGFSLPATLTPYAQPN